MRSNYGRHTCTITTNILFSQENKHDQTDELVALNKHTNKNRTKSVHFIPFPTTIVYIYACAHSVWQYINVIKLLLLMYV